MKGYAYRQAPPEYLALYEQARQWVERLGDPDDERVRCHELARAAKQVLAPVPYVRVDVVDGWCGLSEHTWLELRLLPRGVGTTLESLETRAFILDVYAVGRVPMVQLIDWTVAFKYRPADRPRTDIREPVVDWLVEGGP